MDSRLLALSGLLVALSPNASDTQPRIEQRPGQTTSAGAPFTWPVAAPTSRGVDADRLDEAARFAGQNESDSLLVLRDGNLILERYWNDKGPDDLQQTYSGTKSLFSLIVGRAIERGYLRDLDQVVRELVPEMPEEMSAITFRSVLAMASGLENSPAIEALGRTGMTQLEIATERKVVAAPFEQYHYNNVAYRLLFTALERASGRSLEQLTIEEAFVPLAIHGAYWVRLYATTGDGVADEDSARFTGYQSIRMRPRDFAKSAQIIIDGGRWNGERYLPESFVESLVTSPAPLVNPSFGLFHHLNAGSFYRNYSVPDRIERKLLPGAPDDTFFMYGNGGQLTAGIPSLGLVIVRTGSAEESIYTDGNFFAELVRRIAEAAS